MEQTPFTIEDAWRNKLYIKAYVSSMAKALDEAGIPNILWDSMLLSLLGTNICHFEHSFIVPDDSIDAAYEVLRPLADNVECPRPQACFQVQDRPPHEPALRHLHMHPRFHPEPSSPKYDALFLYGMSQIFHPQRMPDLAPTGRDIMFSIDARCATPNGCGPFPPDLYPARMLTPLCFVETLIRIAVRDVDDPNRGKKQGQVGWSDGAISWWMRHLMLFVIAVHSDKWLDYFDWTSMQPQLLWFYKRYRAKGSTCDGEQADLQRLKKVLLPWDYQSLP